MLKSLRFSDKTFPIASFVVCLLTYGVFIPWLGFYWDDWPILLMGKFFGTEAFTDFYAYDRPFSAWTHIISIWLIGLRPFTWQVYALLLRWLTGIFFWLTLRRVWPQQRIQTAWMVLLFLVHPVFTLQFISVTFSQHWICALLYSFSLWAMLKSLDGHDSTRWLWWVLALVSSFLHLWTMEYFIGMEIFRYVVLWLAVKENVSKRERLNIVFRHAIPYLLILILNIVWRIFIVELPAEDPNPVRFLQDLRDQPLTGLLTLTQVILRDLLFILVQVWANALDPSKVILTSRFFLFSLVFSIVVAVLFALYYLKFARNKTEQTSSSAPWAIQALWVGLLAVILGVLPGWMTYRPALDPPFGNRIVLPALLGLGILIVAFIEWVSQNQRRNVILLSVLCGVSVYSHLYVANTYRETWNAQKNFYWQLYWRVPALEPGTALISDGEVVLGAGDYSTDSAINLMYAREFKLDEFPYWFFNMEQRFASQMERFLVGRNIRDRFRTWQFIGDAENILLIDNSIEGCMTVLAADQPENSALSPLLTQALPLANLDRIIPKPQEISLPPSEIFGPEPAHTWCYYYQQANLARQVGDWDAVVALGEQADQEGYEPVKKSEWLLFVDAYVHVRDFSAAEELTLRIQTLDPRLTPLLCMYWSTQTDLPAGFLESVAQKLGCG